MTVSPSPPPRDPMLRAQYILRKLLVWELLASSIGGLTLLLMFIFGEHMILGITSSSRCSWLGARLSSSFHWYPHDDHPPCPRAGLSHDDDNNQYGEGVQSIAGFQGIWMPVTGVLGMPMLVLSFTTPVRKRILPKMGEDIFRWEAASRGQTRLLQQRASQHRRGAGCI